MKKGSEWDFLRNNYSYFQYPWSPSIGLRNQHEVCVKDRATRSVVVIAGVDKQTATKTVDKVFARWIAFLQNLNYTIWCIFMHILCVNNFYNLVKYIFVYFLPKIYIFGAIYIFLFIKWIFLNVGWGLKIFQYNE